MGSDRFACRCPLFIQVNTVPVQYHLLRHGDITIVAVSLMVSMGLNVTISTIYMF